MQQSEFYIAQKYIFYHSELRLVSLSNLLSHNGKLPTNEHQYLTV